MVNNNDAARPRAGSTVAYNSAPNSDEEMGRAFAVHPRHASRVVLPINARRGVWESICKLLTVCMLPVLLVLSIRIFLLGQYIIPSGSMEDTLLVNDRVLTTHGLTLNVGHLQRGDIVVFHDPAGWLGASGDGRFDKDDFLIKRLIGMPGDRVQCKGAGSPIEINGQTIDETAYIKPGVQPSSLRFDVLVPAGHIFVLGDNRDNSADSRYHSSDGDGGMVPIDNVVGVAFMICWPLKHWKRIDTHRDVFANVPNSNANNWKQETAQ